jgi:hypothetical protein
VASDEDQTLHRPKQRWEDDPEIVGCSVYGAGLGHGLTG